MCYFRKTSRLEDWQIGRLADWKTGRLKDWQMEFLKIVRAGQGRAGQGRAGQGSPCTNVQVCLDKAGQGPGMGLNFTP